MFINIKFLTFNLRILNLAGGGPPMRFHAFANSSWNFVAACSCRMKRKLVAM